MELSVGVAALTTTGAQPDFRGDPGRIGAQIVSGIGFLGAGTILHFRGNVTGLTTAATLWVVAAIGMAVGSQAYLEAIGTTALVMLALMLLGRVEDHLIPRRPADRTIDLALQPNAAAIDQHRADAHPSWLYSRHAQDRESRGELPRLVSGAGQRPGLGPRHEGAAQRTGREERRSGLSGPGCPPAELGKHKPLCDARPGHSFQLTLGLPPGRPLTRTTQ